MSRFWIPKKIDSAGQLSNWQGELTNTFDNIKVLGDTVLYNTFRDCTELTGSINFPSLTTVGYKSLYYTFCNCTGLNGSVNFPSLTAIGKSGLESTFYGCTGLNGSVNFPSLTTVDYNGLYYTFSNCTNITEIHFRIDAKSIIEKTSSYSAKFGASNATIYFDL